MISIGLPVIKLQFFQKAIESCLEQTFQDFELIIVNNAKDKSEKNKICEIVNRYRSDKRLIYKVNEKQLPVIQNWNYVLSLATREFFILLSDDDYFDLDYLEKIFILTQKYPDVSSFYGRTIKVDVNDNPVAIGITAPEHEDVLDLIYYQISKRRSIVLSNVLVKTSCIKKIDGFADLPDGWGSDIITWFIVASHGGICFTKESCFYYRYNQYNVSSTMRLQNQKIATDIYLNKIENIISNYKSSILFDQCRKEMIVKELKNWYKRAQQDLLIKKIKKFKFIPNSLSPVLGKLLSYLIKGF